MSNRIIFQASRTVNLHLGTKSRFSAPGPSIGAHFGPAQLPCPFAFAPKKLVFLDIRDQKTLKKICKLYFRKELADAVILRYRTLETVHGA